MYTKYMSVDLNQYRELYLKTSHDLIVEMKSHLEKLQSDIGASQSIEAFHRAAHSLKSQSLVMGYQQIGTVNRQLEALFLLFKQGELSINSEYIHMVTDIVDHIENALTLIDKSEHEPDLEADIETLKKHTNIIS